MVAVLPPIAFFDEVAELLASEPTPEDLFNFQPSEQVSVRLDELLEKNREAELTPQEQFELDEMLRLGRLVNAAVLKARIRLAGKA